MLRLVHPAREGQGTRPPGKRRHAAALSLAPDERRHLRAALQNLRRSFGSWAAVGAAMGVREELLVRATHSQRPNGSPALALLAARVAKLPVESLLSGAIAPATTCPTCGSTVNARLDRAGGAT